MVKNVGEPPGVWHARVKRKFRAKMESGIPKALKKGAFVVRNYKFVLAIFVAKHYNWRTKTM